MQEFIYYMTAEQAETLIEQNAVLLEQGAEVLGVLGNIQGYAIFGVVVVLLIFSYKFFRMFF